MSTPGSGTTGSSTCFVAEHQYGEDIRGDHMIRVVSPQGVFAEAVGTPGATLEIRRAEDRAPVDPATGNPRLETGLTTGGGSGSSSSGGSSGSKGGNSGQSSVSQAQSQGGGTHSGATQHGSSPDETGQSDTDGDTEGSDSGSGSDSATREPLKVRPKDVVGLRAVVVFPDADEDESRDVTNSAEWKSSKPDVASINTTTGVARGELKARREGNATVTARYSGMVAKRKLTVLGKIAKSLRIESANGETSVNKGETLPLRGTVTFDSGQSGQVTEDITWSSSDERVADVDSGGEVEGISSGTATITGTYQSKDGNELRSELEVEVSDSGGGESSGSDQSSGGQDSESGSSSGGSGSGSDTSGGGSGSGNDAGSSTGSSGSES